MVAHLWKLVFKWIPVLTRKAPGERRPPPSSSFPTCDLHSTQRCACSCREAGVPIAVALVHGFDLWKIIAQGLSEIRNINKFKHLFLVPLTTCQFHVNINYFDNNQRNTTYHITSLVELTSIYVELALPANKDYVLQDRTKLCNCASDSFLFDFTCIWLMEKH